MSVQLYRSLGFLRQFAAQLTGKEYEESQITSALIASWKAAGADTVRHGFHIRSRSVVYLAGIHHNRTTARRVARWALQALGADTPIAHAYPLFRALVEIHGVQPWALNSFVTNAFGHRSRYGERRRRPPAEPAT